MLSRVADSTFWMSRYIERAENIARFINVNWNLMLDSSGMPAEIQWQPLLDATADSEIFAERYGEANAINVVKFLCFDQEYPNSIYSCMAAARENARSIREIIPIALWEQVNMFYLNVRRFAADASCLSSPHDFLSSVIADSNHFIGLSMTTMMHDEGWHFCRLGRLLERGDKTSRILDVKYYYLLPSPDDVGSSLDHIQWAALLRSASALQAYRQRYGPIQPDEIVKMLLLDREFPRGVRYCVERSKDSLQAISGTHSGTWSNEAERLCGKLEAELTYTSPDTIVDMGVHEFIDQLQTDINAIGQAIYDTFFAIHPEPTQSQTQSQ